MSVTGIKIFNSYTSHDHDPHFRYNIKTMLIFDEVFKIFYFCVIKKKEIFCY